MNNKVIVIAGPTASGKTALGISLARQFNGEIVSADSMQIYRGMDIGTAKATPEEQAAVPHHMIDVVVPSESYSVARYVEEASACCDALIARGKIPVIVGGTGLYIDSLLSGRTFEEAYDCSLRDALNEQYDSIGGEAMLDYLRQFDAERASVLHTSDKKRIVRAIEVYRLSGITITEHDRLSRLTPPRYSSCFIIPGFLDRSLLYERIDRRVDLMVSRGLFDEVRALLESGVSPDSTAMQAIGYKEVLSCFNGKITSDEAVSLIKQSSRRYAKRQLTWFNRHTDALRLYHDAPENVDIVASALSHITEFI